MMMMMMIFSLYFPILLSLSLSLSFLLHAFKKHIHYFFGLALASTAFKSANNNATDNYKINLKCNHIRVLDSSTTANPAPPPPPPPPSTIGFVDDIGGGEIDGFMSCTESLGFESSDERRVVDDQIDDDDDDDKDELDECWRRTRAAEGRGNWRKVDSFPPPLSSLNGNGQRSFSLVAMRKNGRLQLNKIRIKRPEILYSSREDGRLRLYLVPDLDNAEEEEYEEEEEDVAEEIIVESEEEEEDIEVVEEIIRNEQQDRVGEWKFPIGGNEGFRRCHQVVNLNHHHHYHHHLHMYGIGIA